MSKRANLTTQEYLTSAPLPLATATYTVIPHKDVIDLVKKGLAEKGFGIERELYRCNLGAQVAQGVYHLKYGNDPDMGLLFAWSNSYDKSMRFRCTMGGFVHESLSAIIGDNMGTYGRKHTGTADTEVYETIKDQIEKATDYFKDLQAAKELMKTIQVTEEDRAQLVGKMYFINEILTSEQMSIIRQEFNKPSFNYSGVEDSVWQMYNAIVFALQKSHPKTWIDQQIVAHFVVSNHFGLNSMPPAAIENEVTAQETVADPRQLNILDEIEKAVVEEIVTEKIEVILKEELVKAHTDGETLLPRTATDSPEVKQIKKQEAVLVEEQTEDDGSWPCLGCGKNQSGTDVFHDGQLCTECNSNKHG
jgi:hypothetical protein